MLYTLLTAALAVACLLGDGEPSLDAPPAPVTTDVGLRPVV